ncbi:STAS domain-containing protein [Anaerococcus prevotii]|uniref:Anti-sigma factor antagonist n=1 Tax=Anaerococcus prevotii ACS-065-V-Col13 TaxID=879305 RepID=F0GW29_9FIRM|nr:STAS domain-containing protein [Anaerococcus prevotii]EGC81939.1 putative anti-sigma-B factor antagonist [Anaerococcus prevotii ACS-065-V-Col13]MDU5148902.1 STAS domain-containing protein [Anaerococcus prevotii]
MFKANIDKKDDYLILNLAGDLDVYSEEEFRDFIEDELKDKNLDLVIDIKDLDYLDSTGLGMFMKIYKMYEENGQKVKIINPKENILKLFKITDLTDIFEMV